MKRREFIVSGAGLIVLATPFAALAATGAKTGSKTDADIISAYRQKELSNKCQSVSRDQLAAAVNEVNPSASAGLLGHSIGCRYPHKHVLFIPQRYLESPSLIDAEIDSKTRDGIPAKTFFTSHSFDMSDEGLADVGVHQHVMFLTRSDLEAIASDPAGVTKIAYLRPVGTSTLILGHIFDLKLEK